MSNVWFCSDLHIGHKNIGKFRSPMGDNWKDEEANRETVKQAFLNVVHKKDVVYCLGDIAFTMEAIDFFKELPGKKILIRGNHDTCNTSAYLKAFEEVYGLWKYKEFWLSHAPVHTAELRGKVNLHGHVHYATVKYEWDSEYELDPSDSPLDPRYYNCCPEALWPKYNRPLVSLDEIRKELSGTNDELS